MRILNKLKSNNILFIDIETSRLVDDLTEGTDLYKSWEYKMARYAQEKGIDLKAHFKKVAGLYAEYSRVICITIGVIDESSDSIKLKTYRNENESILLTDFMEDLSFMVKKRPRLMLCGFSIVNFDVPFLMKRCYANQVVPHAIIDVAGIKPWNVKMIDLKDLWKATGLTSASLVSVCVALGLGYPKDEIDGSMVGDIFHSEGEQGVDRIVEYCEKDVVAIINVFRRLRFESVIKDVYLEFNAIDKSENIMEKIMRQGTCKAEDTEQFIKLAKDMSFEEKEMLLEQIKAALTVKGGTLSEALELEILKA